MRVSKRLLPTLANSSKLQRKPMKLPEENIERHGRASHSSSNPKARPLFRLFLLLPVAGKGFFFCISSSLNRLILGRTYETCSSPPPFLWRLRFHNNSGCHSHRLTSFIAEHQNNFRGILLCYYSTLSDQHFIPNTLLSLSCLQKLKLRIDRAGVLPNQRRELLISAKISSASWDTDDYP